MADVLMNGNTLEDELHLTKKMFKIFCCYFYNKTHPFFFFGSGGSSAAKMASSNTFFNPFCEQKE